MTNDFGALVDRLASRLTTPPPVVTPAAYRAITCNRCGMCCEDIPLPYSPTELAALVADPATDPDSRAFYGGLQAAGPEPLGWRYTCRHFSRDAAGLGVCAIRETRPDICRNFPYGKMVRRWVACAWYVDVRDDAGNPVPVVDGLSSPAVGQGDEKAS
jgi:Fe-S-cluster containining protein